MLQILLLLLLLPSLLRTTTTTTTIEEKATKILLILEVGEAAAVEAGEVTVEARRLEAQVHHREEVSVLPEEAEAEVLIIIKIKIKIMEAEDIEEITTIKEEVAEDIITTMARIIEGNKIMGEEDIEEITIKIMVVDSKGITTALIKAAAAEEEEEEATMDGEVE